jgi:hypothetical protein
MRGLLGHDQGLRVSCGQRDGWGAETVLGKGGLREVKGSWVLCTVGFELLWSLMDQ